MVFPRPRSRRTLAVCWATLIVALEWSDAQAQGTPGPADVAPTTAAPAPTQREVEAAQSPTPAEQDTTTAPGATAPVETDPSDGEDADPAAADEPDAAEAAVESADGEQSAPASSEATTAEDEHVDFSDLEAELSEEASSGPKLDLYGFADFAYQHWVSEAPASIQPSFWVGNFNLYLATDYGANWRSLAEVRFLYLPNGNAPLGDLAAQRMDTTVADYADFQRPLRWGGVEIERVWLEHTVDPLLSIRGGQWLTPYGIWNVDHGSPVIIATNRPYIVGEALFPERQTGLQIHGYGYLGDTKLGYNATLSNGRGPTDAYADLDGNKAVGGRLFVHNNALLGDFMVGASIYAGRYTDSESVFGLDADGVPAFTTNVTERYDEVGFAADLKWVYEGFHLQSEVVVQDVTFDDEGRPSDLLGRPGFVPDYRRWGGYALVGYRFDFIGIMPYFNAEYYDPGPVGIFGKIPAYWFGVNIRPIPSIVLKAQYLYADDQGTDLFGDPDPFQIITTQAAWSF